MRTQHVGSGDWASAWFVSRREARAGGSRSPITVLFYRRNVIQQWNRGDERDRA